MFTVRPKKHLGQHFLHDHNIARKIAAGLSGQTQNVLEVGPGTGMLTQYLLERENISPRLIEIDPESIAYLRNKFPVQAASGIIIEADFLKTSLPEIFNHQPFAIIGNFPYNISSQIFFRIIEFKKLIPEVVGMVQKEVAERIAAPPGNKTYGILSVLLQAWYNIEYLFTVSENVFTPPPKVKSAVIRLVRNNTAELPCDEALFTTIVKTAFNQRRKTLRNALSVFVRSQDQKGISFLDKRAEQLGVEDYILLTSSIEKATTAARI